MNLHGQVSLVTGGASGLGAAAVVELRNAGCQVAILDTDEERGARVAGETGSSFFKTDITGEENVLTTLSAVESCFGQAARVLINCAGVFVPLARTVGKEGVYPLERFQRAVNINLVGAFNMTRLSGVPFPNEQVGNPANFAQLARHICENIMFNGETIRLDGALRLS